MQNGMANQGTGIRPQIRGLGHILNLIGDGSVGSCQDETPCDPKSQPNESLSPQKKQQQIESPQQHQRDQRDQSMHQQRDQSMHQQRDQSMNQQMQRDQSMHQRDQSMHQREQQRDLRDRLQQKHDNTQRKSLMGQPPPLMLHPPSKIYNKQQLYEQKPYDQKPYDKGQYNKQPYKQNKGMYDRHDKIKAMVNNTLSGPQMDLEALDSAEKKFNAQSRLFVGNLPRDITTEELKGLFEKYGELGQVYFNKDGAYAFINLDFRNNAIKAQREMEGNNFRGRQLKVRFAAITTGIRAKNLTPAVSNELLHLAFSVFGQIESCRVIVDDRGKPTGEGIIIFTDKKGATIATKKCQEECYFLTSMMRPVIVEPLEQRDEMEGLPETAMMKNESYRKEREMGPHFAVEGSFVYEYGLRYKSLFFLFSEKKTQLERDLYAEMDQLDAKMALAKHEHETEQLRRELAAREAESSYLQREAGYRRGALFNGSSSFSSPPGTSQGMLSALGAATSTPESKKPFDSFTPKTERALGDYDRGAGAGAGAYDNYSQSYSRNYNRAADPTETPKTGTGDQTYDMPSKRSRY